jgi:DNA replication protein
MSNQQSQDYTNGYQRLLMDGSIVVPFTLIKEYARLGLNEVEVMILIQLISFAERENNPFPTFDEISARMNVDQAIVIRGLQKLLKANWISIEQHEDATTAMQHEVYSLTSMLGKLANEQMEERSIEKTVGISNGKERNLYVLFETEFARPLSPMECEMIASWEEQDQYPRELIIHALKESVFAGKLHFRYIDRILLDWQNKKIRTVDQAKQHAQQYRMERK